MPNMKTVKIKAEKSARMSAVKREKMKTVKLNVRNSSKGGPLKVTWVKRKA